MTANHKRVYRLCREERLAMRIRLTAADPLARAGEASREPRRPSTRSNQPAFCSFGPYALRNSRRDKTVSTDTGGPVAYRVGEHA